MNTEKWLQEIDQLTQSFIIAFENLSEKQPNWKPNPDTWSIAQNIDHLITLNSSYFPIVEKAAEQRMNLPWHAKLKFITRFFGRILLKSVSPEATKKMKTFSIWEPSESLISKGILERFEINQQKIEAVDIRFKGFAGKGSCHFYSPANKNLVYKLSAAFDIIVAHEQRHLNQAKGILLNLP
ncbi:MAG: DinB family protein [Bacteroidota bacterium]|nr:DinB family protein [Bacteroidota bacterium]